MSAAGSIGLRHTLAEILADPAGIMLKVQEAAPILTSSGWGHEGLAGDRDPAVARAEMSEPWFLEQFVRAAQWLDQVPVQKTINRQGTSYVWKHVAEAWHERRGAARGGYISNGMLLAACVAMGRRIEPIWRSPNPFVAIPERARRIA